MIEFHIPWLELAVLLPLVGSIFVFRQRDADVARKWTVILSGLAFVATLGVWRDFFLEKPPSTVEHWDVLSYVLGRQVFGVDELAVPLLPLTALLYFLTALATQR